VKRTLFFALLLSGCAVSTREPSGGGMAMPPQGPLPVEDMGDPPFDPSAACATATETATVDYRPVDIIWVIDNSASMGPAIDQVTAGLNAFAQLISSASLDYKIIMVSLRSKTNPTTVGGKTRYGVCIPPPLSGGMNCENGPRFFQSSADILSTQPLEQLLGTLGQTAGYAQGDARGGEPWQSELRTNATKTIVVVSDDNSRFTAAQLETFAGGSNPYNSSTLPPGLLDPSWNGLFSGYTFDGIYGWNSTSDPTQRCTYAGGTQPPSSGPTYTDLVSKTGGVRAKICDGASAWSPFFSSVATAVQSTSKLTCDLAIPTPSNGAVIDPMLINVAIGTTTLKKVAGASACGAAGGWYYDDDVHPMHVLLCPTSCDAAQMLVQSSGGSIQVQFGCKTIIQ
jgi:hypothetical protein